MERRIPTAPLHRYVSLFARAAGATMYADGLTEYESLRDGFAVTLLRSVGELSRSNLPERPGHAGWPAPTPDAQGAGQFGGELALLLHGPRSESVVDEIERVADDVLYPLAGETLRSALQLPPALPGVELEGAGLAVSAIKESEDGDWLVLRCVNLLDAPVEAKWRVSRIVDEAWLARLDETPLTRLAPRGDTIPVTAAPRAIVTVLAR
jgi:alpha-mannosidase